MKVERIVECSCSILQYFWPALSNNWSSFLSGCLRQVLLYNQQSYSYMQTSVCVSVGKVYYPNVILFSLICLGPSFQKMTHHFLLHGSYWPTNLEKNLKPCWISDTTEYAKDWEYRRLNNRLMCCFLFDLPAWGKQSQLMSHSSLRGYIPKHV